MNELLRPILNQISKLWSALDRKATFRWGTVTQTDPLMIRLDGDDVTVAPQSVVLSIPVGRRVACLEQHRRVIVIAVVGV